MIRRFSSLKESWMVFTSLQGYVSQCVGYNVMDSTRRAASIQPEAAVYSGPSETSGKRVTLRTLQTKFRKQEPISMVTAYDYPSAVHVDQAGIDMLLVGDSAAMVVHGHDTTLPITLDDMLVHCRAVSRGAKRPFLLGDLPFGSYESSPDQAVHSAVRIMKEGQMDGVKMEGASSKRIDAVAAVVDAGIAVMGHVGLTPQMISVIGGFRPQGQAAEGAVKVIHDAKALCDAGCFGLVLECVPAPVGAAVQRAVNIPVIGIGAGPDTAGQHPHHAKVTPKFCKQYSQVGAVIQEALTNYKNEVNKRDFPCSNFSPYRMKPLELEAFLENLKNLGMLGSAQAAEQRASIEKLHESN